MKEFVSESADFITTLNSEEEREYQTSTLHEHTDALDKDELLLAITLEHGGELFAPNAKLEQPFDALRTDSLSRFSRNSKSSLLPCSLGTSLFPHRYPLLISDNIQQSPNLYLHANLPLCIDCLENVHQIAWSEKKMYADDTLSLPSPLNNQLLYNLKIRWDSDATNSQFGNEQFNYGLAFHL
uniref:Uncharacterized protein n=1 Tax=Brugia malayi TaxID=6279 RepID=A8Q6Y1_BRUMA